MPWTVRGSPAFKKTVDIDAEMVGFPSVAADTGRTSSATMSCNARRPHTNRVFLCIWMCYADIPIIINVRSFTGQANKKGYKCGSGSLNTYRIWGIPCLRCCFYRAGYHQKNGIYYVLKRYR